MCQVHHPQTVVCIPHQHQYPSHDSHLWWGSKCHQKGTPGNCGGVLRSWEVPLELGRGPGEEHSPVGENWGYNGAEIELRRRGWERGEQR